MSEVNIIGVDLAKRVFQVHGALPSGDVAFRKKLSRSQFMKFLAEQPPCLIAMEACATAHYWGREALGSGHEVRLIPPNYVKPFVKRQKNDAADAEAIVEAALRPTMRFVEVKSADQQSLGLLFRARELLVRQRTQLINALRGHLAEYGIVVAIGVRNVKVFQQALLDHGTRLPKTVLSISGVYFEQIAALTQRVTEFEIALRRETARDGQATLLQTMPWDRSDECRSHSGICATAGKLCPWSGLCGMAGLSSAPTLEWRQGPVRAHFQNGTARHSQASDHRGHVHRKLGQPKGELRLSAYASNGEQAQNGGCRSLSEQNGPASLGDVR